jgi:gas vesicle protein
MRDEGGAAGAVIASFVLGAITGAAVALLLAPSSGEETRRILGERTKEGRAKATDAARQGREFLDRQRGVMATAVERGRQAYEQARGTVAAPPPPEGESL